MRKYDLVAFDLDGTLSDPALGLTTGFDYAFRKLGIDAGAKESLCRFIGPPLLECWQRELGLTAEEADRAIILFREYYTVYGWRENRLYDGIPELLAALKKEGCTLVVATSKPEEQARKIVALFGLDKYFDYVGGAVSHHERATKEEVLRYSIDSVGFVPDSRCILVGDRRFDAEGALALGIDSLGVTYGHGSRDEIMAAPFTYVAHTVGDLLGYLIH